MAPKLPPEGVTDLPWHVVDGKLIILTPQGTLQFDIGVFGNKKITSVKLHLGGESRIVVSWDGPPVPPTLIELYHPSKLHLKDILMGGAEKFLADTLITSHPYPVSGYHTAMFQEAAQQEAQYQEDLAKAGFVPYESAMKLIGPGNEMEEPMKNPMKNPPTQQDIATCDKCSLGGAAGVPGEWYIKSPYSFMVVGEAPGAMEDSIGRPFVGQSGNLLRSWLKEAGIESYYLTNTCKHRPLGNVTPTPKQVTACFHWLEQEFQAIKPRVVLAVGKTACHALGMKGPMKKMHGMSTSYKSDPQLWMKPITVIGMYHPAYALRQGMPAKLVNSCMSVLYQAKAMLEAKETLSEPAQGWCIPASTSTLPLMLAVDVETDSLDPRTCQSVVWSWAKVGNWGYIPKLHSSYSPDVKLGPRPLVLHHACFDLPIIMRKQGAKWSGTEVHDTMLIAKHLGYEDLSLKGLYSKLFKKPAQTYEQMAAGRDIKDIPKEEIGAYCQHDSEMTADLFGLFANEQLPNAYHHIDKPLIPILARMTLEGGFELDRPGLEEYNNTLIQEINYWTGAAHHMAEHQFNVKSRDQVAKVLHEELHLPVLSGLTKAKSRPIVDDAALAKLTSLHPLPSVLRLINRKQKEQSAFVEPWLDTKGTRLSSIYEFGAETGRLSCHGPNLQQVPEHLRKFLHSPEDSYLISLDYSQIEFRVAAHLSGDSGMQGIFQEAHHDVHDATAHILGISRKVAKTCNFALLYGGGPGTIVEKAGVTWQAAHAMHAKMRSTYPVYYAWAQHQANACRHGPLEGLYGRKHFIPDGSEDEMARQAANRPIQGSAVDLTKAAMVRMETWLNGLGGLFAAQIHDEIILAVSTYHKPSSIVHYAREFCLADNPLSIPIDVTVKTGTSWGEMQEWTAP